ncbi:hypothetical protein B0H66DRAFT_368290 [Apodospora peruviana]|uniref:Uncharacterized protein n=1 Tax=Apodospora peruviana TaxID=516989 RepID=A0AAE0HW04_9PEZI|nr:hypothetical protein B0H66DRAFT_368290 [Apodospora peruviana]
MRIRAALLLHEKFSLAVTQYISANTTAITFIYHMGHLITTKYVQAPLEISPRGEYDAIYQHLLLLGSAFLNSVFGLNNLWDGLIKPTITILTMRITRYTIMIHNMTFSDGKQRIDWSAWLA